MSSPTPSSSPSSSKAGPQFPSPLPVLTVLLVSALLAALGIIMVARDKAPVVGVVFLVVGIIGAVYGVALAVKNVRTARRVEARIRRDKERESSDDDA
jgi:hypothetical protein